MAGATDKGLSKKVHRSWAMYDWANSAYNLVVTSTIFPAYYNAITTQKSNGVIVNDKVVLWGIAFKNSALFDYAIAFAYLLVGLLSPFLSSIADNGGRRIYFLQFFCSIGALACCGLYGFVPGGVGWGIFCATVAAIGYCGSIVFYNAYLPEIALPAEQDKVSALGYAYGYVGSVLLQLVCFVFVLCPGTFGITDDTFPPRLSFLLVGLWWWGFGQVSFRGLQSKANHAKEAATMQFNAVWGGLVRVWHGIKRNKVVKYYLIAFFVYSMGVQTVMLAATLFGSKELLLATPQLIAVILIIQLVAIGGAYLIAQLSQKVGNVPALLAVVCVWMGVCVAAYFTYTAVQFYALAGVVGMVMGGIQSLSRSTYSKLMPANVPITSYFSLLDVAEKLAIVAGMLSFGIIDQVLNMRAGIIALLAYFAAGGALLIYVIYLQKREPKKYDTAIFS